MTAGARFGVLGAVAAVVAAMLWGAWTVRAVPPAEEASTGVAPEGASAPAGGEAEEAAADGAGTAEEAPQEAAEAGAAEPAAGVAEEPVAEAAAEPAAADVGATDAAAADVAAPATEADADAPATEAAAAATDTAGDAAGDAAAGTAEGDAQAAAPAAPVEAGAAEAVVAEPAQAAPVEAVAGPVPPAFDLVRVERDGAALVAGKAAPSSMLSLRVTGAEIAAVPADGQGNFVAMFNLAPSNAPRVLSLVMRLADGTEVAAEGSVVIAPTVAPEPVVAAAEPAVEPAVEPEAAAGEGAEAPAALLVTEEGAKVLQSADTLPAELVANVTVDTITYTPEGAVQLAGRGTAERSVRIYLDNAQVGGDVAISSSGDWAVTLPEVAPGVYTLRADQLDGAGVVTSRFETPFKRETVEALAAASAGGAETAAEAEADTVAAETANAAAAPLTVTVQPGFTLWRIATENLGEGIRYVQVFEANKDQIRDPDLIYPGQVFTIPGTE
ncbi:MAG: peptigoglycan-binding protein LysM [Rhodobacter sp. CACIA14H1]|nr:MAG: peptigoglycan-binding protein LysM [Rhodobacter sp. CACIA14H1]